MAQSLQNTSPQISEYRQFRISARKGFGCHSWPPFGIWRREIESDRNDFNTRNFFIFNLKYSNYINNIFFSI